MLDFLRRLHERHERLKNRIHSFRMPLNKRGQRFMGFVYFCVPVVTGWYIMQWSVGRKLDDPTMKKLEARRRQVEGNDSSFGESGLQRVKNAVDAESDWAEEMNRLRPTITSVGASAEIAGMKKWGQ